MARTKRTVEDANVVATTTSEEVNSATTSEEVNIAAAANNDSKLVTQGKLSRFATRFWGKIKERYDGTFKKAILTEDKELIFTKTDDSTQKLDLSDYVRLQDKNDFKQDVSADNVAILSNRHIGTLFEYTSQHRSLGFRGLTTDSFSDGYVDHIRIYMPTDITPGTNSTWFVWAIKKGANNNKNEDRVVKVIHNSRELSVDSITENSEVKKFVNIPIKDSFGNDTYFIVRCITHNLEVVKGIKDEYTADVINMNNTQPPLIENSTIDWESGANVTNGNTVVMQLFGRESIGTLSQKLNKVSPDSGLYVKHSETTDTGTAANAGKVVKLDNDGKLNKDMLPSIAINEYFEIAAFNHATLQSQRYENGDVAVVNGTGKRYLCINKDKNPDNLTEGFIELNDKDGVVTGVNDKTGAVVLNLEATENSLKLTIGNGTGAPVEKNVPIVTEGDIDSIIEGLR